MSHFGYVYVLAGPAPGVEQKIRDQALALEKIGATDVTIRVISSSGGDSVGRLIHVRAPRVAPADHYDFALRRFRLIEKYVDCGAQDVTLIRYPIADRVAIRLANRHRLVSEHVAVEKSEKSAMLSKGVPATRRWHARASRWLDARLGPDYLSACSAVIGETRQVLEYQLARAGPGIPGMVSGNGVSVSRVRQTRFRPFNGCVVDLAFLGGRQSPWHGIDRLIRSLATHRGVVRINCHLVGHFGAIERSEDLPHTVQVYRHGWVEGQDLDRLMQNMTLAVSSLGLFRNGIDQVAPLKTREYVARGIPLILAHDDPDLGEETRPFCLSVPNDDSIIPVEQIVGFAERVTALEREERLSDQMRSFAEGRLDWTIKMQERVDFLRRLA